MITEIHLKKVRFFAYHGVFPIERKTGNTFFLDLVLRGDFYKATETDCLNDTISYAEVYSVVEAQMKISSDLLEYVAGRIARALHSRFIQLASVRIEISKSAPLDCGETSYSVFVLDTRSK